jgi:hypothetical protein
VQSEAQDSIADLKDAIGVTNYLEAIKTTNEHASAVPTGLLMAAT